MVVDRKQSIIKQFSSHRQNYNRKADLQKKIAAHLIDRLPRLTKPRILEIGCGTGFLTHLLYQKYPDGHFHISDLTPDMVAYCQNQYPHPMAHFFVMDGESPHPPVQTYDLVVSSMAVQWFVTPLKAMLKLSEFGPVYYSTLGAQSFQEWRSSLIALDLPDGTLNVPEWIGIAHQETFVHQYRGTLDFLSSLKQVGTGHARAGYRPLSPKQLKQAIEYCDKRYQGHMSWHIVYGTLERFRSNRSI